MLLQRLPITSPPKQVHMLRLRCARALLRAARQGGDPAALRAASDAATADHRRAGSPRGVLFGSATFSTEDAPPSKRQRTEEEPRGEDWPPAAARPSPAELLRAFQEGRMGFGFSAGGLLFPYYVSTCVLRARAWWPALRWHGGVMAVRGGGAALQANACRPDTFSNPIPRPPPLQIGVICGLQDAGMLKGPAQLAGASAGSLIAACYNCGAPSAHPAARKPARQHHASSSTPRRCGVPCLTPTQRVPASRDEHARGGAAHAGLWGRRPPEWRPWQVGWWLAGTSPPPRPASPPPPPHTLPLPLCASPA
jgi:hypothetical protein